MNFGKILLVIATSSVMLWSTSAKSEPVSSEEYQEVVDTAYTYFNGAAKGDQAMLAKAFELESGHMKMVSVDKETGKETIRSVNLKEFAGFFKKATKDTWQAKVLSVDIVDNKMAMVKLDFDTPNTHYIDYLVMYKLEGNWRIINKTFVANKKS